MQAALNDAFVRVGLESVLVYTAADNLPVRAREIAPHPGPLPARRAREVIGVGIALLLAWGPIGHPHAEARHRCRFAASDTDASVSRTGIHANTLRPTKKILLEVRAGRECQNRADDENSIKPDFPPQQFQSPGWRI